ncbi:hypothetical protein [Flavobacterium capsici]|uniref:Uncharacterized protein n=1 Tax=Flavobacterium capsici TaxID=3075618 RepID=A0AA96F5C2_9FLAO|nr:MULTISPECIES: hypothetical protein [unclassified Flavobacterium]WNM20365.1 hypothetical protein RN608_06710 [Flavobacterium sp. PMR2A8]WNM21755.1 hypothetical protein RN605_00010 [Flavobacterium sp. PMTSA4]
MNKIIFNSRCIINAIALAIVFCGGSLFAQQNTFSGKQMTQEENSLPSKATFLNKTSIILNQDVSLSEFYIADLSIFNFTSAEEAKSFFDSKSDNLLSFKIDFPLKKVIIHLHLKYADKSWDKTNWNTYLNNKLLNQ